MDLNEQMATALATPKRSPAGDMTGVHLPLLSQGQLGSPAALLHSYQTMYGLTSDEARQHVIKALIGKRGTLEGMTPDDADQYLADTTEMY